MTDVIDFNDDEDWAAALVADGWSPMGHSPHNREVDDHIRRCFGDSGDILREHLSKYVHIDIHVIGPSRGRTFTTYVTSGMSDLPMIAPMAMSDWARAELVLALPGGPETHVDEAGRYHYLIELMRSYARRPHALRTFLSVGDTIGPLDEDQPLGPDTRMIASILSRPVISPIVDAIAAFRAILSTGEAVNFLGIEPIYADELELKQKRGADDLIEQLEAAQVFELYNPARPSVAKAAPKGFSLKRLFGGYGA